MMAGGQSEHPGTGTSDAGRPAPAAAKAAAIDAAQARPLTWKTVVKLFAGLPAYLLFRHRYGRPVPRSATLGGDAQVTDLRPTDADRPAM
jgi:hypothetical protein